MGWSSHGRSRARPKTLFRILWQPWFTQRAEILLELQQGVRLFLLGTVSVAAVHELWVFSYRRNDRAHLWYAAWSLVSAAFLAGYLVACSDVSDVTALWAVRVAYATGLLSLPLGVVLAQRIAFGAVTREVLVVALATALPVPLALIPGALLGDSAWRQQLDGSRFRGVEAGPGLWLLVPAVLVATVFAWRRFRKRRNAHEPAPQFLVERRALFVCSTVLLGLASANDVGLGLGWFRSVLVLDVVFSALPLVVSLSLIRRALLSYEALEEKVEERTRDLVDGHARLAASERLASLGTLAAGVGHEINNPLTYVTTNLELLRDVVPAGDREAVDMLEDALSGAATIRDIVRDLQVFAGREKPRRRAVDLRGCARTAIRMANNQVRHRAQLEQQLDPCPLVEATSTELTQVALNLLVNAAHAIPDGGLGTISISTGVDQAGDSVLRVRDSGHGMAPELQGRIFEPFFSTKPIGQGSGLGLSICHGIVQDLGGRIELESEPGVGTAFTVTLPAQRAPGVDTMPVPAPSDEDADRAIRILVVDDDRSVARAIARMLRQFDVAVVYGGREAIERTRQETFDVVVCDLMMPGINGIDVYKALGTREQQDRMVFVTGGAFTPDSMTFLQRVSAPRVFKPVDPIQLRELVRQTAQLGGSSARAQNA